MARNVIFDWSGTLSDDFGMVHSTTCAIFARLGLGAISLEEYKRECEMPYMEFWKKYTPISKEELDVMWLEEVFSAPNAVSFPGIRQELETLYKQGVSMVVLSGQASKKLKAEAAEFGFSDFFDGIYGGAHDKRHSVSQIMAEHGFDAGETCLVGDMEHDLDTAKHAGVTPVAVTWGYHARQRLEKSNPRAILDDVSELASAVSLV
jgi:phosphoglycolate phosphatase